MALLIVAMTAAPGGAAIDVDASGMPDWLPLWWVMAVAALWYAWQEFRAD